MPFYVLSPLAFEHVLRGRFDGATDSTSFVLNIHSDGRPRGPLSPAGGSLAPVLRYGFQLIHAHFNGITHLIIS